MSTIKYSPSGERATYRPRLSTKTEVLRHLLQVCQQEERSLGRVVSRALEAYYAEKINKASVV